MAKTRKQNPPDDWPSRFLDEYRKCGNLSHAARLVGVDRTSVQKRRARVKTFAEAMQDAEEEASDALEMEARRRGVEGVEKPVFYQGDVCGHIREYSDTLLIVLLKAKKPAEYRERASVEHSGPGGGPIPIRAVEIELPPDDAPDEPISG